jgi:hypothetical protein
MQQEIDEADVGRWKVSPAGHAQCRILAHHAAWLKRKLKHVLFDGACDRPVPLTHAEGMVGPNTTKEKLGFANATGSEVPHGMERQLSKEWMAQPRHATGSINKPTHHIVGLCGSSAVLTQVTVGIVEHQQ